MNSDQTACVATFGRIWPDLVCVAVVGHFAGAVFDGGQAFAEFVRDGLVGAGVAERG